MSTIPLLQATTTTKNSVPHKIYRCLQEFTDEAEQKGQKTQKKETNALISQATTEHKVKEKHKETLLSLKSKAKRTKTKHQAR